MGNLMPPILPAAKTCFWIAIFVVSALSQAVGERCDLQKYTSKVDAYTVSKLKEYRQDQSVNLFVILNHELSIEEVEELRNMGCTIRSQAGNVITVNIQVGKIEQLIKFDFVKFVELARPLEFEREDN